MCVGHAGGVGPNDLLIDGVGAVYQILGLICSHRWRGYFLGQVRQPS
jgi:hypothetical protein